MIMDAKVVIEQIDSALADYDGYRRQSKWDDLSDLDEGLGNGRLGRAKRKEMEARMRAALERLAPPGSSYVDKLPRGIAELVGCLRALRAEYEAGYLQSVQELIHADLKGSTNMRIFISHGHNEVVRLKLEKFVRDRLKRQAVVLADEPDDGLTIIEKLERYGKPCSFALIVLTADDETVDEGRRARQNVIHELGFFHGALGRKRVLLLKQKGVELFSNISGLIYKEFGRDNVEEVYEQIRIAVEHLDASESGNTV